MGRGVREACEEESFRKGKARVAGAKSACSTTVGTVEKNTQVSVAYHKRKKGGQTKP